MATKNIKRDALKILREFGVAGELSTAADIHSCKETQPRASSRVLIAVFAKTQYYLLVDNSIEDDMDIALETLRHITPTLKGSFIRNPHEDAFKTYGVRHKFRDTYVFEAAPVTVRLDKELATRYPHLSRATIQKYIKAGYVHVDGQPLKKTSASVRTSDEIALLLPAQTDYSASEIPIIYIDDDIIVVNKPAGMLTHSKGVMNDEFTVADFFRRYTSDGLETNRPGIVHRLDRDTSGVILGARTPEAADMLKKQFAKRTVKKQYVAVLEGVPKLHKALIDVPLARNPSSPSMFKADPKGKPSTTLYEVMKTNGSRSLVELQPKTGRTHQLRIHMKYIGAPILGDRVYGTGTKAERLFLHAHTLEITAPNGRRITFEAPVPSVFEQQVGA